MASLTRLSRHLLSTQGQVKRAFPRTTLTAIEQAIRASEATHGGEVRFVVEGALSGPPLYQEQTPRERAIDVFSVLRMWDTADRNGVLIYLLLADRSVEIVTDRGVHAIAGAPEWERICAKMEQAFRDGRYERGVIDGIREVGRLLERHFPSNGATRSELPDKVVVL